MLYKVNTIRKCATAAGSNLKRLTGATQVDFYKEMVTRNAFCWAGSSNLTLLLSLFWHILIVDQLKNYKMEQDKDEATVS